jgi:hypothetical protein
MNTKSVSICTLLLASCVTVFADDEAGNQPVVRSSEYGRAYAKSVPAESYGQKGKTQVFRVGKDADTVTCAYDWYANEIYMGGAGDQTLIRFGPWHRGDKPQKTHLALGIYLGGKRVREYTTLELEKLGCGVSMSISHYTIFRRRLGFHWLKGNEYVYEVEGVSGKIFTFDLDTGAIVERTNEQPAEGDAEDHASQAGGERMRVAGAPTLTADLVNRAVTEARKDNDRLLADVEHAIRTGSREVPRKLLPLFTSLLKEKSTRIQRFGLMGIIHFNDPSSQSPLVEYIKRVNPRKVEAEWGTDPRHEPEYSRMMMNASVAVMLLGDIADESAIPFLESLYGIRDLKLEWTENVAHRAVQKIKHRSSRSLPAKATP